MTDLFQWAAAWNVPHSAVYDLMRRMGQEIEPGSRSTDATTTETDASQRVRLDFAQRGGLLWRNNVGVLKNERGVPVRYGLANESKQMNKRIKSSDLIGIQPIMITADMIGRTIGQFVAWEIKKPGWIYKGTEREHAQKNFIDLVISRGGNAKFTTGN